MGKNKRRDEQDLEPEVARALSMYAPEHAGKVRRSEQRVLKWVNKVHDGLVRTDVKHDVVSAALSTGVRSDVFYLEGLLKLYRKRFDWMEPHFQAVKRLEDTLGICEMWRGLVDTGRKAGLHEKAVQWLKDKREKADANAARVVANDYARTRDNLAAPALRKLVDDVLGRGMDGRKKDKKALQKEIVRRLEKSAAIEYDMNQLQGDVGIHELRRQLRWFPIYAVALDGFFVFDEENHPVEAYRELLGSEVAKSRYAQIPANPREKDPVAISRSLYVANTSYISELGTLKDTGEDIEGMEFALKGAGLVHDHHALRQKAQSVLGLTDDGFAQLVAEAEEVAQDVIDNDLFGHFARDVKNG